MLWFCIILGFQPAQFVLLLLSSPLCALRAPTGVAHVRQATLVISESAVSLRELVGMDNQTPATPVLSVLFIERGQSSVR